jgi:hypothetical protein
MAKSINLKKHSTSMHFTSRVSYLLVFNYPEAKMALPPVQRWAASAEHSALEVGFERGKIIGGLGD